MESCRERQNVYPTVFSFFFFGVKVYLSFWGLVQWKGEYVTEIMSFRSIWQGKKNERIFTFCKNLICIHRWSCSGAILITR